MQQVLIGARFQAHIQLLVTGPHGVTSLVYVAGANEERSAEIRGLFASEAMGAWKSSNLREQGCLVVLRSTNTTRACGPTDQSRSRTTTRCPLSPSREDPCLLSSRCSLGSESGLLASSGHSCFLDQPFRWDMGVDQNYGPFGVCTIVYSL